MGDLLENRKTEHKKLNEPRVTAMGDLLGKDCKVDLNSNFKP